MKRTYGTLAILFVLCLLTGCLSFQVRNPALFPSCRYLPPWKWVQIERVKPVPRGPHLALSVDDFIIWSHEQATAPEHRGQKTADIMAPFLREIESELNAPTIRSVWSDRLGISLPKEQWPTYQISRDMRYLMWEKTGASNDALRVLARRAYWYACVRLAGFSTSYAMRSQVEGFVRPPDSLPEKTRSVLLIYPHVPPALLCTRKFTCESGHQHETLYVIDNGIAWVLVPRNVDLAGADIFWFCPERLDAQEFDPGLAEAFAAARRKTEAILEKKGITGIGTCNAYCRELQKILWTEYDIKWRSPLVLNPNTCYD